MKLRFLLAAAILLGVSLASATDLPTERTVGRIEPVFEFYGAMPTGVSVALNGRIFVNFPRWGDDVPFTVGEIRAGRLVPYPDAHVNRADKTRPGETFISVQSVVADAQNRLWVLDTAVLDTAAPNFTAPVQGGTKLVAVDLVTNRISKTIVFAPDVALPKTYLNDVRFDLRQGKEGVAYITDSGTGALIVVDLASGTSWRRLLDHYSTKADPTFVPIVEGETLLVRPPGGPPQPLAVPADGIALSSDGTTLYFCPLSSRHLFSVPTALLRDRSVLDSKVGASVVDLGEKGASDGLEADAQGHLYAGNYEHDGIRQRLPDGTWKTIVHDPRVLWPDTLSVGPDGWLYFTANQLERQAQFHGGHDLRQKPYTLFRAKIGGNPVALK
jgi:sugar lactone lactonase YvrE